VPLFVNMDLAPHADRALDLVAIRETEGGLVCAGRKAPLQTRCLLNVDALVIFDFDDARRLGFVEVIAPYDKWPVKAFPVPEHQRRATLLLSEATFREGSIDIDEDVTLSRSARNDAYFIDFDKQCQSGEMYALGPGVACRVHNGALKSFYLSLSTPGEDGK
jgi:hypothetical protein